MTTKDTSHVQEYHLYGSSRLGTYTPQANDQGKLILGLRNYELTNHLGNVLAVISDKKKQNSTADIVSASDYYPFGMPLKSRSFEKKKYRFGFNGHEKDKSFGRDHVNFGARIYDSKTTRWLSVDPLAEKYPSISPYAYVANNPIIFIDPDGRKVVYANGSTAKFKKDFQQAVKHLRKYGAGEMLAKLEKSEKIYYISETSGESAYNRKTNTISWNPTKAVLTNEAHELSPTTILNHEVDHALQHDKNPKQQKKDGKTPDAQYGNKEEKRVIEGSEQETAKKLGEIKKGEVTRKDHGGYLYETTGPTSTEWKNAIIVTPEKDEKNK